MISSPDARTDTPANDLATPGDERDRRFMALAQAAAEQARAAGEVPVGAVIVRGDEVIATGFNHPIGAHDPSLDGVSDPYEGSKAPEGLTRVTTISPSCDAVVSVSPTISVPVTLGSRKSAEAGR